MLTPSRHKKHIKEIRRQAFTLAEVMITIAIIALIYAFGIRPLVTSIQNAGYEAGLKKETSVILQAYNNFQADGNDMTAAFPGTNGGGAAMNMIAPYLKIIKSCSATTSSNTGCWYTSTLYQFSGSVYFPNPDSQLHGWGNAILADGVMIGIQDYDTQCTTLAGNGRLANSVCGTIWLDINGAKGPNIIGRDVFAFWVTKTGVIPYGTSDRTNYTGITDCFPTAAPGWDCASQVLTSGMNY